MANFILSFILPFSNHLSGCLGAYLATLTLHLIPKIKTKLMLTLSMGAFPTFNINLQQYNKKTNISMQLLVVGAYRLYTVHTQVARL